MLLRQDFRGRHQRHLITIFDGDNGRLKTDDGFARTDVSLQQTPHGIRLLHVLGDFLEDPFLGGGGMKRQNFLDGLAHAIIGAKSDASFGLLLTPLELQAEFDEEQFFEDQTDVRGRAAGLQVREAFASFGPMHFPEGLARRNQSQALAHGGRNRFRDLRSEIVERFANDAAKPAGGYAALPGRFVDRHDAAHFERRRSFVVRIFGGGIAQHLKLRLDDLQFATLILLDLPV